MRVNDLVLGKCYKYEGNYLGRLLEKKEMGPSYDREDVCVFEEGTLNFYTSKLNRNGFEECDASGSVLGKRRFGTIGNSSSSSSSNSSSSNSSSNSSSSNSSVNGRFGDIGRTKLDELVSGASVLGRFLEYGKCYKLEDVYLGKYFGRNSDGHFKFSEYGFVSKTFHDKLFTETPCIIGGRRRKTKRTRRRRFTKRKRTNKRHKRRTNRF